MRAVRLSGEVAGEPWLREWLTAGHDVSTLRTALMMSSAQAPAAFRSRGRIVCSCHGVAQADIESFVASAEGADAAILARLRDELRCGTGCGSCVPELKQLIAA
jgi:assimilatory nitrate reductase catalytic subunit